MMGEQQSLLDPPEQAPAEAAVSAAESAPPAPGGTQPDASQDEAPNERRDAFRGELQAIWAKVTKGKCVGTLGGWVKDCFDKLASAPDYRVSHNLRMVHPRVTDRGRSVVNAMPRLAADVPWIGTHSIGDWRGYDYCRNGALLPCFSLMESEVLGRPVIEWACEEESDFLEALTLPPASTGQISRRARAVAYPELVVRGSPLMKEVYWPLGEDPTACEWRLLCPLPASRLIDLVQHLAVAQADQSGAFYRGMESKPVVHGQVVMPRSLPGLTFLAHGGDHPEGVGLLANRWRPRGRQPLLPAAPPEWKSDGLQALSRGASVWGQFAFFQEVPGLVRQLARLLLSRDSCGLSPAEYRGEVELLAGEIGLALSAFAAEVAGALPAGWSARTALPPAYCLWLDPERISQAQQGSSQGDPGEEREADLRGLFEEQRWPDEIASAFARWLNRALRRAGVDRVGDAELATWVAFAQVDGAARRRRQLVEISLEEVGDAELP